MRSSVNFFAMLLILRGTRCRSDFMNSRNFSDRVGESAGFFRTFKQRQRSILGWKFPRPLSFIVLGTVYAVAHWIPLHQLGIKRLETIDNALRVCDSGIKPPIIVLFVQNGRHPVVYFGHD